MNLALPVVAGTSTVVASGIVLYRIFRPRFNVKVNCWFCRTDHVVPYGNQNCWDCPHCEQYNGFTEDGAYNKPIPAQYTEDLNHPITAESSGSSLESELHLCVNCNRNQLLKVKQLASFVPSNEANFDFEAESYKRKLEQVYRLCRACEIRVQKVLRRQDIELQERMADMERSLNQSDMSAGSDLDDSMCTSHLRCRLSTPWHVKALRLTSLLCAITLLILNAHQLFLHSQTTFKFERYLPRGVIWYLGQLMHSRSSLVLLGVSSTLVAVFTGGKERLTGVDAVACFLWLGMLVLHSAYVQTVVPSSDLYLLQAFDSMATAIFAVWCSLCERYEKTSRIRIKTRRKRSNLNHSSLSSGSASHDTSAAFSLAEDNHVAPPPVTPNKGPHLQEPVCRDKLESMSLGPLKRSPKPGVFSQLSFSTVSSSTSKSNPTHNHGGLLASLAHKRPLISPARLKVKAKPVTGHMTGSSASSSSSSLYQAQNVSSSNFGGSASRQLFSYHRLPTDSPFGPFQGGPGYAPSAASDDRASLFSEARYTQGSEDEDDQSSHHSSRASESSECQVDTTCYVAGEMNGVQGKKRSFITRIFFGVVIGVAACLVAFYFFDWRSAYSSFYATLELFLPLLKSVINRGLGNSTSTEVEE